MIRLSVSNFVLVESKLAEVVAKPRLSSGSASGLRRTSVLCNNIGLGGWMTISDG